MQLASADSMDRHLCIYDQLLFLNLSILFPSARSVVRVSVVDAGENACKGFQKQLDE